MAGIQTSIRPELGSLVYRTSKASQLQEAVVSYKDIYSRKISITGHATIRLGENPVLIFRDSLGVEGSAAGEYQVQSAVKRALDKNTIQEQLGRLGDTPFELKSLELELDSNVFVPVSVLNQLRRDAIKGLIENRIAYYDNRAVSKSKNIQPPLHVSSSASQPATLLNGYVDRLDYKPGVFEGLDILSYVPATFSFQLENLISQVKTIQKSGIEVRLVLPTITRKPDMDLLGTLPEEFWSLFDDYQIGNLGQLKLLREKGIDTCFGSHTLNVTNSLTMAQLSELGLKGVTLSPELTTGEIRDIINRTSLPWRFWCMARYPYDPGVLPS